MSNLERFINEVKAGRVPGMRFDGLGISDRIVEEWEDDNRVAQLIQLLGSDAWPEVKDWLCAAIRRALTAMGIEWWLGSKRLELFVECVGGEKIFSDGSELDQHLAAILFALEAQNENR